MTETEAQRFETRGTYETLDERREALTEAEERFERRAARSAWSPGRWWRWG